MTDFEAEYPAYRPLGLPVMAVVFLAAGVLFTVGTFDPSARWAGGDRPPLVFLAAFWFAAIYLVYLSIWSWFGREVITIDPRQFGVRRVLFGRTLFRRVVDRNEITEVHFDPVGPFRQGCVYFWSWRRRIGFIGPVAVEYPRGTLRLAEGLRDNPAQAQELVAALQSALFTAGGGASNMRVQQAAEDVD